MSLHESNDHFHSNKGIGNTNNGCSKTFQCIFCNFKTKYKHNLNVHNLVHESSGTINCKYCDVVFPSKQSMVIWHCKNDLQEHVNSKMRQIKKSKNKRPVHQLKKKLNIGGSLTDERKEKNNKATSCPQNDLQVYDDNIERCPLKKVNCVCETSTVNHVNANGQTILESDTSNLCALGLHANTKCIRSSFSQSNSSFMKGSKDMSSNNNTVSEGNADKITPSSGSIDNNNNETDRETEEKNHNEKTNASKSSGTKDENNNVRKQSGDSDNEDEDSFHEVTDSPKSVEFLICLICQTSFSVKGLLMKHLIKVHHLTNLCQVCYFHDSVIVKFANPVSLRNHRVKFHEKEMKKCVCGTLFIDDKTLCCHQKKFRCDESELPKLQRCICGKRFSSEKELNAHKVFKCRKRHLAGSEVDCISKQNLNCDTNTVVCSKKRQSQRNASTVYDLSEYEELVNESPCSPDSHKKSKGKWQKTKRKKKKMVDTKAATKMKIVSKNTTTVNGNLVDHNNNVCDSILAVGKAEKQLKHLKVLPSVTSNCLSKSRRRKQNKRIFDIRSQRFYGCKVCAVRVKRCHIYIHQKLCHQRKLSDPARKFPSGNYMYLL